MATLKLNCLNKIYPSGEKALHDVSLQAEDKELLVIVGEDGSGKSSLLRIIAGLEDATSGEVDIDGKNVTEEEPKNRDVAMIFQSSTLYPSLNVFDNLAFGLRARKAPEALVQERVKAVSNILGLNDMLYRKPKVLTSAAKQRVALGRAMAREPKIYLFDEPLAGLDDKLKLDMINTIVNVQTRVGGTFVYATKNVAEALSLGTRLVVMKDGFMQQSDMPANLYDYPANTYVAFYIGSPTINFIKRVKIVKTDSGYKAQFDGGETPIAENIVNRFKNIDDLASSGRTCIMGVRPEDIKISADGTLNGTADKVFGEGEKYAEVTVNSNLSLTVSAESDTQKGANLSLKIDSSRLYFFDAESCLTLLERDGGYIATGLPDADFTPLPLNEEQELAKSGKPKQNKKK